MLGEFKLSFGDKTVTDKSSRSKKVWLLLEYLILFRNKDVGQEELIDIFWPNNESDNPGNALKTLLFRVRSTLNDNGLPGHELIMFNHGSYTINPKYTIQVDCEKFDSYLDKARMESNTEIRADLLLSAAALYKGDFLPKSSSEHWALPVSTYYRSRYIAAVHELISLFGESENYEKIISICQKAINIDPYDESLHYSLIKALVHTGSQQKAMEHYIYVKDLFFTQFGINLSPETVSLYKEVVKTNNSAEMDLTIIRDELKESVLTPGAFFCEYEFFKNIYQLSARSAMRSGQSAYICLLTITDKQGKNPDQKILNRNMESLSGTISNSLRVGDVYTRYSLSQYLVMLSHLNFENADTVIKRILRKFKAEHPHAPVKIIYSIQPLIPAGM